MNQFLNIYQVYYLSKYLMLIFNKLKKAYFFKDYHQQFKKSLTFSIYFYKKKSVHKYYLPNQKMNQLQILLIILTVLYIMLKFKEIKRSIIHPNQHNASPILLSKKCYETNHQISFKNIKQFQQYSPLAKKQLNEGFNLKYDTDKKNNGSFLTQFNMKSEAKQNNPKCLYYNRVPDVDGKILEFGVKKRKVNNVHPSQYYDKSYENSASKNSQLSFANLIQSKRPENVSKKKNYLESDRKNDRQSSISKLKQKLFGMKKVISDKQAKQLPLNRCETERNIIHKPCEMQKNIFTRCQINVNDQDIVKVSIKKDEASIQELDMAPYI